MPVSRYNNETVAFDGLIVYVFGSPVKEMALKLAVRSYPTPAVFDWPNAINVSATQEPGDDVTVIDLSVFVTAEVTYNVTGRNGDSGQLTTEIRMFVKPRGMTFVW